jgi:hypothetical protein
MSVKYFTFMIFIFISIFIYFYHFITYKSVTYHGIALLQERLALFTILATFHHESYGFDTRVAILVLVICRKSHVSLLPNGIEYYR